MLLCSFDFQGQEGPMIGGDSSGGDPCSPQSPHHPHHHPSPHGASSQLYQPPHPGYVTGKAAAGGGFSGVGGGVTTTPLHPHHQPSSQPQAALAPLANNNHHLHHQQLQARFLCNFYFSFRKDYSPVLKERHGSLIWNFSGRVYWYWATLGS